MKNKFRFLSAALVLSVLVAGCAKDGGDSNDQDGENGDVSKMVLTVQTLTPKSGTGSRAADDVAEATTSELTIYPAEGLKVAVFNASGILQADATKSYTLTKKSGTEGTETAVYSTPESSPITLPEGSYYFFVFANDKTSNHIVLPTGTTTMSDWMDNAFNITYDGTTGNPSLVDATTGFVLGTLWKQTVTVAAGGTADDPLELELPALGRLSAKIWVTEFKATAVAPENPVLSGTFTEAKYTVRSVAKKMTNVGVVDGANNPFYVGRIVTSALHNDLYNSTNFDDVFPGNSEFWKTISMTPTPAANQFYYVAENTTARTGTADAQYHGNTTYIMLELKYVPADNEVLYWDGEKWGATGQPWNPAANTFWSTGEGESRKIYGTNPINSDPNITDAVEHTHGYSYYTFPVQDVEETDIVARNRVLRNHYYEYTIDKVTDLGSDSSTVPDDKPLDETTSVYLSVKVGKWDKVTTGGIEL